MFVFMRIIAVSMLSALTVGATEPQISSSATSGLVDPVAVLRLTDEVSGLRMDPRGRFLAFHSGAVDRNQSIQLKILDLKTSVVSSVGRTAPGPVFSWTPDGFRLIYSESSKNVSEHKAIAKGPSTDRSLSPGYTSTQVSAFDVALQKSRKITKIASAAGYPTMDSRALGAYLLTPVGLTTVKLAFPDDRLARWQIASGESPKGKYIATSGGMVWVTGDGSNLTRLDDDGSSLESFSVSPDGSAVTWATADGYIYKSMDGQAAELIDRGRDPSWHPQRSEILYAGAVLSGNRISGYDLKIHNSRGKKFLTRTPFSNERWPQRQPGSERIFYTIERTTDIFMLESHRVGTDF